MILFSHQFSSKNNTVAYSSLLNELKSFASLIIRLWFDFRFIFLMEFCLHTIMKLSWWNITKSNSAFLWVWTNRIESLLHIIVIIRARSQLSVEFLIWFKIQITQQANALSSPSIAFTDVWIKQMQITLNSS